MVAMTFRAVAVHLVVSVRTLEKRYKPGWSLLRGPLNQTLEKRYKPGWSLLRGPLNQTLGHGGHGTGKMGIWMLTFPDRENTGNLVDLILTKEKLWQQRDMFENFEKKSKIWLLKW